MHYLTHHAPGRRRRDLPEAKDIHRRRLVLLGRALRLEDIASRYWDKGQTAAEIAADLGITTGAVYQALTRITRMLTKS